MTTTDEVMCPKCGGKTWDNRETKRNPKAPDYKCRDKACDGAVWPPKGAVATPRAAAPAPAAKQGYSVPPYVAGLDDGSDALPTEKLDRLFAIYDTCLGHTLSAVVPKLDKSDVGSSPEAVAAVTATLFIAAKDALR